MGTLNSNLLVEFELKILHLLDEEFRCGPCDRAATFLAEHFSEYPRGVAPSSRSTIFVNAEFEDDIRSQITLCTVYQGLRWDRIPILGFGLDKDRTAWTLEVESNNHESLMGLVSCSWDQACNEALRRRRALARGGVSNGATMILDTTEQSR